LITLDIQCPDHLKTVFDERPFLEVDSDERNVTRDTLLLWAASSKSALWLSEHPNDAREALAERFQIYPRISFNHITFTKPSELTSTVFQKSVIECSDFDVRKLHSKQIRVIKQTNSHTAIDTLGLPLDERIQLLTELRLGSTVQYDEYELIASITRESYFQFIKEFWGEIIQETPVWNWHIPFIAGELQKVAKRVFNGQKREYDLIINIPPGTTKSTMCSRMFSPWIWTNMPSAKILGGAYSGALAANLSRKAKDLVVSDKYLRAFPSIKLKKDMQAKSHFENTQDGSRYSFGIQGTVTGMHAHFINIDDPLNPERAISEVELNKANRVMSETLFTRKVDKEITVTSLIMQRLHQNDCTQHMLDTYEKVKVICLPDRLDDNVQPERVKQFYVGGLLDPIRLNESVLKSNEKALGTFSYAGQFSQRPVPRGGAMFKPLRIVVDARPLNRYFQQRVRYWDKAGTQGGGCYTAGVEMGIHNNDSIWILDVIRGQWGMDEREAAIKAAAKLDGRECNVWVEQEPGSGGKDSAFYTIKNLRGYHVQADKVGSSDGNKVMRAGPFADQVNIGNVFMVKAEWNKSFIDEHTYFPASKYKDQVDAASGAFNKLTVGEIEVGAL